MRLSLAPLCAAIALVAIPAPATAATCAQVDLRGGTLVGDCDPPPPDSTCLDQDVEALVDTVGVIVCGP